MRTKDNVCEASSVMVSLGSFQQMVSKVDVLVGMIISDYKSEIKIIGLCDLLCTFFNFMFLTDRR